MLKQLSFQEVNDRIADNDKDKWDHFVDAADLRLEGGMVSIPPSNGLATRLQPNQWATGQLCRQLGIPGDYFRKCPVTLQDSQFNHWAEERWPKESKDRRQLLLRADGEELRAVLSSRYAPIDNHLVWQCIQAFEGFGLVVESLAITEVSFHLRMLSTQRQRLIEVGDEGLAGIVVANSEVGMRSITIDSFVHRLVCSNGLVIQVKGKSFVDRRHVGAGANTLKEILPVAVRSALQEADQGLQRFANSVNQQIARPEEWLPDRMTRWQLSEDVQKNILALMMTERPGRQDSLWNFINAVTEVAQSKDPDERYRLEALAGSLLAA